jgi:hypothetical protein
MSGSAELSAAALAVIADVTDRDSCGIALITAHHLKVSTV